MKRFKDLMELKDRVSLVVGGGGYIGSVICETLAELGANVIVHDISKEKSEPVALKIKKEFDVKSAAIEADLLSEKETREIVPKVIDTFGRLDILIHCAAFVGTTNFPGWAVPFEEQSVKGFESALRVNLTSAFILSQDAQKYLAKNKKGSIVFISSMYGIVGPDFSLYDGTKMANPIGYGASKGGLILLTKYLATLFAPSVRVNCISPGGVFRNQDEKFVKRYKKKTPLGRMAKEEDIKGAIGYLSSDLSEYVTGQNIVVDGGFTVW